MTPRALAELVEALRGLPGVGPRAAKRMAYHLLQHARPAAARLAVALDGALDSICHCRRCNTFAESEICDLCASFRRNPAQLCVVETPVDMSRLEETQAYQGLYYVLLGHAAPLDGMPPEALGIDRLLARLREGEVTEVILATNYTNEGEATAHYLAAQIAASGVSGLTVSRLARGVPVGGELEFTAPGTLAQALRERRRVGPGGD
jgi:recombination protein RecR